MNAEIVELLRRVGVPAHVKGYTYLKDALDICWSDRSYLDGITKRLYPAIAKREGTTPSRVERAIRHAIEIAVTRPDAEFRESLFGVGNCMFWPTNSEFIATLTEQLHLEYDPSETTLGG
jgi:two-component system response regulator (stage 0 sporulation protein A)